VVLVQTPSGHRVVLRLARAARNEEREGQSDGGAVECIRGARERSHRDDNPARGALRAALADASRAASSRARE
jgi:hypothetical protein